MKIALSSPYVCTFFATHTTPFLSFVAKVKWLKQQSHADDDGFITVFKFYSSLAPPPPCHQGMVFSGIAQLISKRTSNRNRWDLASSLL